jgi:hypothetical protein
MLRATADQTDGRGEVHVACPRMLQARRSTRSLAPRMLRATAPIKVTGAAKYTWLAPACCGRRCRGRGRVAQRLDRCKETVLPGRAMTRALSSRFAWRAQQGPLGTWTLNLGPQRFGAHHNGTRSSPSAVLPADLVQLNRVSAPHLTHDRPPAGVTPLIAGRIFVASACAGRRAA